MSLLQENNQSTDENQSIDETRREFLRKSVYAAYATPVIVALLVSKADALTSAQCLAKGPQWSWDAVNKKCRQL